MDVILGDRVRIHGLKNAAHLNGLDGVVVELRPDKDNRWEVELAEQDHANVLVREGNLRVTGRPEEEPPMGAGVHPGGKYNRGPCIYPIIIRLKMCVLLFFVGNPPVIEESLHY